MTDVIEEKPTGRLRIVEFRRPDRIGGRLQQEWLITERDPKTHAQFDARDALRLEWRDVPIVKEVET